MGYVQQFKFCSNNGFPFICALYTILENIYFILRNPSARLNGGSAFINPSGYISVCRKKAGPGWCGSVD